MEIKKINEASQKDAFLLSNIARSAKATWGYEEELLNLWEEDLTITPDMVNKWPTYLIQLDSHVIGFCMLNTDLKPIEIEHFWLLPDHQGNGFGKQLLSYVLNDIGNESSTIGVASDPFALAFYEKMGFVKTHDIPSTPEGRHLPFLVLKF